MVLFNLGYCLFHGAVCSMALFVRSAVSFFFGAVLSRVLFNLGYCLLAVLFPFLVLFNLGYCLFYGAVCSMALFVRSAVSFFFWCCFI